jgi:hypothetical protein
VVRYGLNSSGSGRGLVARSCEQGENLRSHRRRRISGPAEELHAPWSYFDDLCFT